MPDQGMIRRNDVALTPVERFKAKLALRKGTGHGTWMLLDVSGSMDNHDSSGTRKIDALRTIVDRLRETHTWTQIVFESQAYQSDIIIEPTGGTNLTAALNMAADGHAKHIIVVSDGSPDNAQSALECAKTRLAGVPIDTFYVGPEGGYGQQFLADLASMTGGKHGVATEVHALTSGIRLALAAGNPAPTPSGPIAL